MYYLTMDDPIKLYETLMAIKSQKDGADIILNCKMYHPYGIDDAIAFHDVLKMFAPGTPGELNIELWQKGTTSCFFLIVAAALPKEKVFIGEAHNMFWNNFGEYVWGNEAEQEDQLHYHKLRKEIVDRILSNSYDMEIEDMEHLAQEGELWFSDDVQGAFGFKLITDSPLYSVAPEKLELKKDAVVGFCDDVYSESADRYINTMEAFRLAKVNKMLNVFKTPGGDVHAILNMMDARSRCNAEITTIAIGLAASAGGAFLISGQKGRRFVTPNTIVMIHQFRGATRSKSLEVIKKVAEKLTDMIVENSKLSRDEVKALLARDTFMTAETALEYGFIDGILGTSAKEAVDNAAPAKEEKETHGSDDLSGADDYEQPVL